MKIIKLLFLLTLLFSITFSCGNDDGAGTQPDEDLEQQQNETENRNIPIAEIDNGIIIEGATKITGVPPAPNGSLNFQIDGSKQEAFQLAGFDIDFTTTDNIEGAYIVFKEQGGAASNSYFDVPVSALIAGKSVKTKTEGVKKSRKVTSLKALVENNYVLDVDFDQSIGPGDFCYEICLYDLNGNISAIETVCLTVEAWGGNSEIVGEWIFDRYEPAEDDNAMTDFPCLNGQTLNIPYSIIEKEEWIFVLSANGDYYETYNDIFKELDAETTYNTCTATYDSESTIINEKYSGKWAYNEDNETLTVIDFKYEDFVDSTFNETYDFGQGYFDRVKVDVISNELVITETYVELGQQFTDIYIFKKK